LSKYDKAGPLCGISNFIDLKRVLSITTHICADEETFLIYLKKVK
jgi:hypothetical protein